MYNQERNARLNKDILRVKSMLLRAESGAELSRLTGLLLQLQREYIEYLEKTIAKADRVISGKVA